MGKKIAIIGGGNLGLAIADGLLSSDFCAAADMTITKRKLETLQAYAAQGVSITADNLAAVQQSDLIILAVKPFQIKEVLELIRPALSAQKLLVSVVTGITLDDMKSVVGDAVSLIRAMPNTAIAIRQSITCLSSHQTEAEDLQYVQRMFEQLGKIAVIDEGLMNAATVLGACGTAYAMRYIRANIQGGIEIGFDAKTAALIAAQTVKGAAELLLTTHTHPEQEIDKVTTPKGCTIAGLNEMEHQGFSSSLIKGIAASYKKIS